MSGLLDRLNANERSNELDVLVEVALFQPCDIYAAARANSAGTKVIYTRRDGREETCWAPDWSREPDRSFARAALSPTPSNETNHTEGAA